MDPQTQIPAQEAPAPSPIPVTTASNTQLDPDVVKFTHAIALQEGGGKLLGYDAKSGDVPTATGGRYQFTPDTWHNYAQQVLGDQNAPMTAENQNKVIYTKMKGWRDQGKTWAQMASMWNAGEGAPDSWKPGTVQAHGNTPQYVKNVQKYALQLEQQQGGQSTGQTGYGGAPLSTLNGANDPASQQTQTGYGGAPLAQLNMPAPTTDTGGGSSGGTGETFTGDLAQGNYGGAAIKGIEDIGNGLFPIAGDISNAVQGKPTGKTGLQIAGDAGLSALPFIPGIGEGGLLTKLLAGGAMGYGAGVAGNLAQGQSLPQAISPSMSTVGGALTGGALGGASHLFGQAFPRWLTQAGLKVDPETADYALSTKGINTIGGLASKSSASQKSIQGQIESILGNETYKNNTGAGAKTVEDAIAKKLPRGQYTPAKIGAILKRLVPTEKDSVDRLVSGDATLLERNTLRKELDATLNPKNFQYGARQPSAEQQKVGKAIANALRDEVQKTAPETQSLFHDAHLEANLGSALNKLNNRKPGNLVTARDLMSAILGNSAGGPIGAALGYGAEKLGTTPTGQFALAKFLRTTSPYAAKAGISGVGQGISSLPSLLAQYSPSQNQ